MKIITAYSSVHGDKQILVDDEDYDYLMQWKWYLRKGKRTFYAVRGKRENGKYISHLIHRFILKITDPKIIIDHKDHDGLNNQRANLRLVSCADNNKNQLSHANTTSQYLGVCIRKRKTLIKWEANISCNKKFYYIGVYDDEKDAARAYDVRAKELFGNFANLNFK